MQACGVSVNTWLHDPYILQLLRGMSVYSYALFLGADKYYTLGSSRTLSLRGCLLWPRLDDHEVHEARCVATTTLELLGIGHLSNRKSDRAVVYP